MKLINYKDWAKYISVLYDILEINDPGILELACGQCAVTKHLQKKFPDIISTDISIYMLNECDAPGIKRVCCDMVNLPFKEKFGFVFSTFDSINYLLTEEELKKLFTSVSSILNDEGYFTFDVSLERNSIKYQKLLNRSGKYNGIKYVQKSNYNKEERIHYNTFKFTYENGEIYEETHAQKIYEFEDYFRILEETDFNVFACFDSFSFDDADKKTERAQFVLKKRE